MKQEIFTVYVSHILFSHPSKCGNKKVATTDDDDGDKRNFRRDFMFVINANRTQEQLNCVEKSLLSMHDVTDVQLLIKLIILFTFFSVK